MLEICHGKLKPGLKKKNLPGEIDQFRYIKIQPKTKDEAPGNKHRVCGILFARALR